MRRPRRIELSETEVGFFKKWYLGSKKSGVKMGKMIPSPKLSRKKVR